MEIVAIMATIILIATLATLIFAFAAYFITKAKRKRAQQQQQVRKSEVTDTKPVRTYFERYMPHQSIAGAKGITALSEDQGLDNSQWT